MAVRMLSLWRIFLRRDAAEAQRTTHRQRLRALAAQWRVDEQTLVALDNLRRAPLVSNLARLVMALMIDRVLLVIVAAITAIWLALALPAVVAAFALVVATLVVLLGNYVLARARGAVDSKTRLDGVPEKIRRLVSAPFIVFGHSHHPVAHQLDGGGWYFNTGTWVPPDSPEMLSAFTHLLIRHREGGPEASLCQWRDGRSQEFRAT